MAVLLENAEMLEALIDAGGDFFKLRNDLNETPFFLFQRSNLDQRIAISIIAKMKLRDEL